MKLKSAIAALSVIGLLAGCASTTIGVRSGAASSARAGAIAPGSSYVSTAIDAELRPYPYFGLLFLGYIAAGVEDGSLSWSYGPAWRTPPLLAEDRAIAERDCSRPMEQPSANLRCK